MKKIFLTFALSIVVLGAQSCKKSSTSEITPATENGGELINVNEQKGVEAPTGPLTTLALHENNFDFGNVKKGTSVEHVYEVTNTGKNPLIISKVVPGCGCTAPEYTQDPIMPGKTGKIKLSFDSSNFEGLQHKRAEVFANIENAPVILTFSANVQP